MDVLHQINLEKRKSNSITHRQLRTIYNEFPFDMNLIASNGGKVPVHHFVLVMFSPYVRKMFINKKLIFEPGMSVPLKEFSHEVLMDAVKMFYLGETAVRTEMLVQFHALLQRLSFTSTDHGVVKFNRPSKDIIDDLEGWEESDCKGCKQDLKKMVREKLFYGCSTPACEYEFGIKLVDDKLMRKIFQPNHSVECNENDVNRKVSIQAGVHEDNAERSSRKRAKNLTKIAKLVETDEGSSSSGDDVPKKQPKKQDALPEVKEMGGSDCVANAESEVAESELISDIEANETDENNARLNL